MSASPLDTLTAGRYIRLTTFKRDGTAVPTPVWVTRDGDRLTVITQSKSGKLKRLAHTSRVLLCPSDWRGKPTGEEFEGTAQVLGDEEIQPADDRCRERFGMEYKVMSLVSRIRGADKEPRTVIAITV
jgi:uncharacterized protein